MSRNKYFFMPKIDEGDSLSIKIPARPYLSGRLESSISNVLRVEADKLMTEAKTRLPGGGYAKPPIEDAEYEVIDE